jgi:hypothetical protein
MQVECTCIFQSPPPPEYQQPNTEYLPSFGRLSSFVVVGRFAPLLLLFQKALNTVAYALFEYQTAKYLGVLTGCDSASAEFQQAKPALSLDESRLGLSAGMTALRTIAVSSG